MSQLSLFSADARPLRLGDLAGLLCGPGRIVRFGSGDTARLSVDVPDSGRARAVSEAAAVFGIALEPGEERCSGRELRTAYRRDLAGLARLWTTADRCKRVPAGFQLDGAALRLWVLSAGRPDGRGGYLLPLDPAAPATHDALIAATTRLGLPPARVTLPTCGTCSVAAEAAEPGVEAVEGGANPEPAPPTDDRRAGAGSRAERGPDFRDADHESGARTAPNTARISPNPARITPNTGGTAANHARIRPDAARITPATAHIPPNTDGTAPNTESTPPDTARISPNTESAAPHPARIPPNTESAAANPAHITPDTAHITPATAHIPPNTESTAPHPETTAPNADDRHLGTPDRAHRGPRCPTVDLRGAVGTPTAAEPATGVTPDPALATLCRSDHLSLRLLPTQGVECGAAGPALRITGARRLERLLELIGPPPPGVDSAEWPKYWGRTRS